MYSMRPIFYVGTAISLLGVVVFWVLQLRHRETVEPLG
jgi:hypothetical protein